MKTIGITIGPIYKTMTMARKTREFWGASILFSLISKCLCDTLISHIKEDDFIVPGKNIFGHDLMNYGLYLDRIIFVADESIWSKIDTIIDDAINAVAIEISNSKQSPTADDLKRYFKIYAAMADYNEALPLKEISEMLNTLEMYNRVDSSENVDSKIKNFIDNVNTEYEEGGKDNDEKREDVEDNSFLVKYFNQKDFNDNIRIPSITEVCTIPLSSQSPKKDAKSYRRVLNKYMWTDKPHEDNTIKELSKSFDSFKNYYKYIAILQADGDKLGSYLMKENRIKINQVSEQLNGWGKKVFDLLSSYGALSIYIGGDDVMCFAPINNGSSNIIELAKELNNSYKKLPFTQESNSTLSIGIKLCYYKSPMGENYGDTFPLLREEAKEYQYNNIKADACAIGYDKHSGQPHKFVFNFSKEYDDFIKPLLVSISLTDEKKSFINSVGYFIRANEQLIFEVYKDKERYWHLFENNFNEAKKEKEETPDYKFIKALTEYLHCLLTRYEREQMEQKEYKATTYLYSALKTIKFIKGLDQDHE